MFKLLFVFVYFAIAIWHLWIQPRSQIGPVYLDSLELRLDTMRMLFAAPRTRLSKLEIDLAVGSKFQRSEEGLQPCLRTEWDGSNHCVEYDNVVRLEIDHRKRSKDKCYTITWTSLTHDFIPQDCVSLNNAHWFGGAVSESQRWPMNNQQSEMKPYVTSKYGPMLERYWLSSKGMGIYVHNSVPLHLSWNHQGSRLMCLKADYNGYPTQARSLPVLKYTVCEDFDIHRVHQHMFPVKFGKPQTLPPEQMMTSPIWYTGYNNSLTENDIVQYVKDIRKSAFPTGYIDIGTISNNPGDFALSSEKNPSGLKFIEQLHKLDIKVTAAISTFLTLNSLSFHEALDQGYLMHDLSGEVPALLKVNSMVGAVIDVTNSKAIDWFLKKVNKLQTNAGIDTWRLQHEGNFPIGAAMDPNIENPSFVTEKLVEIAENLGKDVIVEAGCRSQRFPQYSSLTHHARSWEGLRSVIPQMLLRNLQGYPYTLPGPIGGTSDLSTSDLPTKELYIRWLQLGAYMPAMQFSVAPWQYDKDVVKLARNFWRTHEKTVYPLVMEAAAQMLKQGDPIIRPLWWHHPHDPDSLAIDSEYMIGDSLLVAPILNEGARGRDIYLPRGQWKDNLKGDIIKGRQTIKNYTVKLSEIATFELVKQTEGSP